MPATVRAVGGTRIELQAPERINPIWQRGVANVHHVVRILGIERQPAVRVPVKPLEIFRLLAARIEPGQIPARVEQGNAPAGTELTAASDPDAVYVDVAVRQVDGFPDQQVGEPGFQGEVCRAMAARFRGRRGRFQGPGAVSRSRAGKGLASVERRNAYSCQGRSEGGFSIPRTIFNQPRMSSPEGQEP